MNPTPTATIDPHAIVRAMPILEFDDILFWLEAQRTQTSVLSPYANHLVVGSIMPPLDPFKIERESGNNVLTFRYPELPYNTDFETFRKTDKQWQRVVEHYDKQRQGVASDYKERFIFSFWPRDPNGPAMQATPRGKVAGNGFPLWGATLYDFYHVHRIPSCAGLETISTGSKLAAWMKSIGELDYAKDLIQRASLEDEPYELKVYDIGHYIEVLEEQVWKGRVGKSMEIDRTDNKAGTQVLYAPSEYPAPWPLRPFSAPLARLQKKIPRSALPQKLIVHDPWNALVVTKYDSSDLDEESCKWGSTTDIIRTYHLKLTENSTGNEASPKNDQHCREAHLYISPKRHIGRGNHSFTYQVELELPRELLVQPKVCYECLKAKYHLVRESAADWKDGDDIPEKIKKKPLDEFMKDVRIGGEEMDDETMQENYSLLFKQGRPFVESDRKDPFFEMMKFVQRQTGPPYCEHLDRGIPVPPSQRVSVIAKLSFPDDDRGAHSRHLRDEAANYQAFPSHMSEHWNGYNIIPPSLDPTPVGAIVPQFYGFYVPDEDNEPIQEDNYMSAILLLEHCGVQVSISKLSTDERQECFSLLRRLHIADYLHESVAPRNILMQYGPITESPFKRSRLHPRFRLIDFGRTRKVAGNKAKVDIEVEEARNVLKLNSG